jgi:Protein of unknown function (DUF3179)
MAEQQLRGIFPPAGSFRFMNIRSGKLRPYLVPLTEPTWMSIGQAEHMRSDDPVLALTVAERAYILPWWVMKNHHVANLRLDDRPVMVTLCERCSSAAAFDPLVEGDLRTFQVVGSWKGSHVVADHQTESVWASFMGECIWGYHHGVHLERLPLLQMSWEDCTNLLPEALVVDGAGEPRDGHGSDRFPGSAETPLGLFTDVDPRLPSNELVLGVEAGGATRTYPLERLIEGGGVFNDAVGGVDIVVIGGPSSYTGAAFERRLGDRILRFAARGKQAVDEETGSVWDVTGLATSGSLAGQRLTIVDSHVGEWYAWAAYQPTTDIAAYHPATAISERSVG